MDKCLIWLKELNPTQPAIQTLFFQKQVRSKRFFKDANFIDA